MFCHGGRGGERGSLVEHQPSQKPQREASRERKEPIEAQFVLGVAHLPALDEDGGQARQTARRGSVRTEKRPRETARPKTTKAQVAPGFGLQSLRVLDSEALHLDPPATIRTIITAAAAAAAARQTKWHTLAKYATTATSTSTSTPTSTATSTPTSTATATATTATKRVCKARAKHLNGGLCSNVALES